MHDRVACIAPVFTRACSCDVGHTQRADAALAWLHSRRAERRDTKTLSYRDMNRLHPATARTNANRLRRYVEPRAAMFSEWAACSPSSRSFTVMPDRQLPGLREHDRADAPVASSPLDRDQRKYFEMGRRPLSPWALLLTPSRPAGHPRVHRADARGWLSLAQP